MVDLVMLKLTEIYRTQFKIQNKERRPKGDNFSSNYIPTLKFSHFPGLVDLGG